MKKLIFIFLSAAPLFLFSQTKNVVTYKAKNLRMDLFQISDSGRTRLTNKVLGVDVEIAVDTVFKSYTLFFTNEDYQRTYLKWVFVKDLGNDNDLWRKGHHYKMLIEGDQATLDDYLESQNPGVLAITMFIPNNKAVVYSVVEAIKQ